mmetsp:Transcript_13277/g.18804  ORF Transcript_13277/g.18804 Transcript_13277/m.18804 type:complete len:144 (-) Transcript_13277:529-960(-)
MQRSTKSNNMSSNSFGQWYNDQKAQEGGGGGNTSSSSFFGISMVDTDTLPLFGGEGANQFSFASMKQSMEAQMPQQILGMNYQQRFKMFCALLFLSALFFCSCLYRGITNDHLPTTKIRIKFYIRIFNIHGKLWNINWSGGSL